LLSNRLQAGQRGSACHGRSLGEISPEKRRLIC
jgi:hypothetical protein